MAALVCLCALAFAGLAIPSGRRWRREAWRGARLQAHHAAVRFALAIAAAVVLSIIAAGRFA